MDAFAKALQSNSTTRSTGSANNLSPEIEANLNSSTKNTPPAENPLANAMARAGGIKSRENSSPQDLAKQQEEQAKILEKEQKKKALHLKLHKEVTGATDIFNADKEKTRERIEQLRKKLEADFFGLNKEVRMFKKYTGNTAFQAITDQGIEGTGMINYLEKIRQFIRLLRKNVHSARTWAQSQNAKSSKKKSAKKRKGKAGIEVSGGKAEQSKAVFDQMHHENSTVYAGA